MAQPHLAEGEGPITLVLSPTRELAQQTHGVALQFCSRTAGRDTLRAGVIFGGVSPDGQYPGKEAPDYGRWPELLVATPGRLLQMLRLGWLSPARISYVVFDEADLLLSHGWRQEIREVP